MAQDLSGLYISQSFQNLVQRSASGAFNVLATATGTEFIPISSSYSILASEADHADRLEIPARAAEALEKGDPVYVSGYNSGQERIEVSKADASDPSKMPVAGLAIADVSINDNTFVIAGGSFVDVDTETGLISPAIGDTLYVAVGGGFTNVKPTGSANLIQNVGKIGRVQQNNGEIVVSAILRSNDLPNIQENYLWLGDANGVPQAIPSSSLVTPTPNLQSVLQQGNSASIDLILSASAAGGVLRMAADGAVTTIIDINNELGQNQLLYQVGSSNNRFVITPTGAQQGSILFSTGNSSNTDAKIQSTGKLVLDPSSSAAVDEGEVRIDGLLNAPYSAVVSGSLEVTGSLIVTNGITGSLDGNASTATSASHALQADNAISSSYAVTASYAENSVPAFPFTGSALITGSLAVTGSVSVGNQSGNNTISANSALTAGSNQNNTGNGAVILGGSGHTNSGETSAIVGGESNSLNSDYSGIFGAASSTITNGDTTVIIGGYQNNVQGLRTFTLGGNLNVVNNSGAEFSGIIGGQNNTINGPFSGSVVIGGSNIQIQKHHNVAVPTLDVRNGNVEVLAGDVNVTGSIIGSGNIRAGQSAAAFASDSIELGSTAVPIQYGNVIIHGSNTRDLGNKYNSFQIVTQGSNTIQFANSAFTGLGNDIHLLGWGGNSTGRGDNIKLWSSGSAALLNVETETRFASSVINDIETITIASNTASIDLNTSNTFQFTAQSTATHIVATNITAGQVVNIQITQDAGGAGTITFDPAFKFPGGTAPALTTSANAIDLISAVSYDGTSLLANGTQNYS